MLCTTIGLALLVWKISQSYFQLRPCAHPHNKQSTLRMLQQLILFASHQVSCLGHMTPLANTSLDLSLNSPVIRRSGGRTCASSRTFQSASQPRNHSEGEGVHQARAVAHSSVGYY